MSNIEKFEITKDIVLSSEHDFKKLAEVHGAVDWQKEASFAVQILKKNNYLASVAYGSPDSLRDAVLNVASIGLSLSPVSGHAYILPRDGKVCLDISYKGYLQLAIDSGAILWARCEIVYEQDDFIYNGAGERPSHRFDPFAADRGKLLGCYCLVKLSNGDFLVDMMPIADIFAIRDRSKSYQAYKKKKVSCPWVTDEGEMIKKTVIRRAFKMWPIPTESKNRLEQAMVDGFEDHEVDVSPLSSGKVELIDSAVNKLEQLGRKPDSEKFLGYLARIFNRKIESVDGLTEYELKKLHAMLDQWIKKELIENPPPVQEPEPQFELEDELELEDVNETPKKEGSNEESRRDQEPV